MKVGQRIRIISNGYIKPGLATIVNILEGGKIYPEELMKKYYGENFPGPKYPVVIKNDRLIAQRDGANAEHYLVIPLCPKTMKWISLL